MMGNRRQHELLTHYNDMKMETVDDDNGEVSIRRMVTTARWNLLEDNRQMYLTILDNQDETRIPLRTGPWRLKRSMGPA
jgi:hypothetical protein